MERTMRHDIDPPRPIGIGYNGAPQDYSTRFARYSKGNHIVAPLDSISGYKGRASYVLGALNCRYTHREGGYVLSPSKLARFEQMFADGWTATCMGDLCPPRSAPVQGVLL